MIHAMKSTRKSSRRKKDAVTLSAVALVVGGLAQFAASTAGASGTKNTFVFKGAYSGTIKYPPSTGFCSYGKAYSGKGYLVTLSHMTGTIKGAGSGPWALTLFAPKIGTNHLAKANPKLISDSSFQNAATIVSFFETSGTITYNGATGSLHLTVVHHVVGSTTYRGISTVTGSWSC